MNTTATLINGPEGAHTPYVWVMDGVHRCEYFRNRYLKGYYRNAFGVTIDGINIGTVASFNDGSGWHATSVLTGGPNNVPRSATAKTRKDATAFLVATAAGMRWHT